uniref:PR domain zinc finger protein 2-like n=1 Tax=Cyanistes caeruleus TaxID=156563 RepID=A0A8C0U9I6_CYACU
MNHTTDAPVAVETLDDVPEHVLRGLPEDVRLFPSAVDKTRLGVWATKSILKGKKFGPFVGDKKKRSQVKSNVYMWEVYYPNLGWMCVDATDPEKGNWLRYINWARSGKEQNLFPLEINRTIYYKSLKVSLKKEILLFLIQNSPLASDWKKQSENTLCSVMIENRIWSPPAPSSLSSERGELKIRHLNFSWF